jgi:hypothetical protein
LEPEKLIACVLVRRLPKPSDDEFDASCGLSESSAHGGRNLLTW